MTVIDLTNFSYRGQFLAVVREQHGSRIAQFYNKFFLKVDTQGISFMHDPLAVLPSAVVETQQSPCAVNNILCPVT